MDGAGARIVAEVTSCGWAARRIAGEDDVLDVIELLRLNYDRAVARHGLPEPV